jgi:hypothetical protein
LARGPDAFDGVASPQPGCDLVLSPKKTGVRLVVRSVRRRVVWANLLRHRPYYRFWRPKVFSNEASFFARPAGPRRPKLESTATRWISLVLAETERELAILVEAGRYRLATDRGELPPITERNFFALLVSASFYVFRSFARACNEESSLSRARCGIVRHRRCPQSPLAALNAFGLFAAGASGRARPHTCQGWRPPAFRRRSPLRSRAIYLRHVENARADNGTSLDGVPYSWSFTPRLRTTRSLDRTCAAPPCS